MRKIISLSVIATVGLYAGSLNINDGWSLMGAPEDVNQTDIIGNSCITSVWQYDESNTTQPWSLYHKTVTNHGYPLISSGLTQGSGFWVLSDGNCTMNYGLVDTLALSKSLATTIASSSSGLAGAGEAAGTATSSATSATDATDALAKILYNVIPSFANSGGNMEMSIPMSGSMASTNADIVMKFNVGGTTVDSSNIMDSNGTAYGLDSTNGLQVVAPQIGLFFCKLLAGGTPDFTTLITSVNTMKASPLFSLVGDTNFQNFFNTFPTDSISAGSANWQTLGTNFASLDLANNTPSIDFSQIGFELKMTFSGDTPSVDGIDITFPPLVAVGDFTDIRGGTGLITMNFKSDGNGTVGTYGTMSNIDINATIDRDNPSTEVVIDGKYDITILANGHTYKGSPTFDINGCKGADIYDESGTFISRMKIFSDGSTEENGLWIVDVNNTKIEKIE